MGVIAGILVALVAAVHVYIVVLEMFLWQTPRGQKAFGLTPEFAAQTAVLAGNQGLYNGFLAAGLFWGLLADNFGAEVFFLVCVIIAGIYGAATANKKILFIQTVPAALALLFVFLAR